jgi:hypothetical protein
MYKAHINRTARIVTNMIMEDFQSSFSIFQHWIGCPVRKSINNRADWHNTLGQMNLIDIFRIFHPAAAKYTFFSSVHGSFFGKVNIVGHKTGLNKFKKTEIIFHIQKMFLNNVSAEVLICIIYKEILQLNRKNTNNLTKNGHMTWIDGLGELKVIFS